MNGRATALLVALALGFLAIPLGADAPLNLKTAKTLGLTISQSVLLRADHVIQ